MIFDYVTGGAGDERSLRRNRDAFRRYEFVPKRLRAPIARKLSVELLGKAIEAPFFIGPTGLNGLLWPKGDLAMARAAAKAGIPFVLSTAAQCSIESIAEHAGGDLWFQLYGMTGDINDQLRRRAHAAGYRTLVLTVDVPMNGDRQRDLRNDFRVPIPWTISHALDALAHPKWLYSYLRHGSDEFANLTNNRSTAERDAVRALRDRNLTVALTWSFIEELRAQWSRRLVVKGILDANDAAKCIALGVDAVILSNHGGRQLDDIVAPVAIINEVAARVGPPLLFDGGVRGGSDIVKALALGATAAGIGRAALYGLAAAGETGVTEVITLLKAEIDNTLAQIGCTSVSSLNRDYIRQH